MPLPAIEIADLTWRPAGAERLTLDLRGTSITVPAGGVLFVTGESGAGKSTLLRAIAGLLGTLIPGELRGRLIVGGVDLVAAASNSAEIPRKLSQQLGFVAAGPAPTFALPLLLDDAALPLESRRVPTEQMRQRIERTAREAAVDLSLIDRSITTLSGGERAAAAALVALVASPELLIADEPLGGLDAGSAERLAATLRAHRATRIIAAHDLTLVRVPTAQTITLADGKISTPSVTPASVSEWGTAEVVAPGGTPILQLVRAQAQDRAVGPLSIAVISGATTLVTGATGSGKSTLLGLVAGSIPLEHGERIVASTMRIRFAPQDPSLLLGARPARTLISSNDVLRGERVAERFGVTHLLDAPPGRLSDGERRRLSLVVALAASPDLLILDEPTGGLDDARVAVLCDLLSDDELLGSSAVLIATHDPRLGVLNVQSKRPLRRVHHPEETGGSSGESPVQGLAGLLPAPAVRVAESAERLLSPELGRRLIGTSNPLTRLGLALFWFALSVVSPATPVAQAAIALPALVVAWASGVQIIATMRLALALTPAIAGIVLANLLGGATVETAIGAGIRLVAFAAGSLVLLRPFEPLRMADACIEWLRTPFAHTMALLATAARVPSMQSEARERRAIRRLARGGADPLLLVDMFDAVIRAVPQLGIALEVRGVRLPTRLTPPTRRRPSRFGRADLLIVTLSAGGLMVSIARAILEAILGA